MRAHAHLVTYWGGRRVGAPPTPRTLTRWMAEREPSVDERSCPRLALMKKAKLR